MSEPQTVKKRKLQKSDKKSRNYKKTINKLTLALRMQTEQECILPFLRRARFCTISSDTNLTKICDVIHEYFVSLNTEV